MKKRILLATPLFTTEERTDQNHSFLKSPGRQNVIYFNKQTANILVRKSDRQQSLWTWLRRFSTRTSISS